ncbi:spirocyclase AveC family protein [Streptosporangium sp. NPDC006007]|uniref:spirocyclase AveC family protein n=1 Tax=Streptosporangium sp. NPDC006007 TaxID=3154575 RepID=UPI00339F6494
MTTSHSPRADAPVETRRRTRPVLWFAAIGVVCTAFALFAWTAWIVTGRAIPTATGPTPVPLAYQIGAWAIQGMSVAAIVWSVVHVVRQCRRQRRVTYDALALIGGTQLAWLEPYMNFFRPAAETYNSYYFNLGSWGPYLPGFLNQENFREPLPLLYEIAYGAYFLLLAKFGCRVMNLCAQRWPHMSKAGLIGCLFATFLIIEPFVDNLYVRLHFYQFWNTIPELTLWSGETYQYPIYEAVVASALFTSFGALRHFRDNYGNSLGERGADESTRPLLRSTVLRFFGVTGCLNLVFGAYVFIYAWSSVYGGPIPGNPPSYMLNNVCGVGAEQPCSVSNVPITR